jgi:hypothetical protein
VFYVSLFLDFRFCSRLFLEKYLRFSQNCSQQNQAKIPEATLSKTHCLLGVFDVKPITTQCHDKPKQLTLASILYQGFGAANQ